MELLYGLEKYSFFIVLYWDWEWGVDQSYGCTKIAVFQLLSIAMFQIMCFKTKMKVCYNTTTSCLFVFLTFYYSCIEE